MKEKKKKKVSGIAFGGKICALAASFAFTFLGLAGCSSEDDFANADTVTLSSFETFQTTASNSMTNYVFSIDLVQAKAEMHYIETTDADENTSVAFAISITHAKTTYGDYTIPETTSNFYAKGDCLYISEGSTKAVEEYASNWYDYSSGLYNDYTGFNYNYPYLAMLLDLTPASYLSSLTSSFSTTNCNIKKLSSENYTKYQIKLTNIDEDDGITSYTLKLSYDDAQQLTDFDMEAYTYSNFYQTGMTYTVKITASSETITYPDLSGYVEAV